MTQRNNWNLRLYAVTESYNIDYVLSKLIKYDKYCYCLHDRDVDVNGELKKPHYHVVIHSDNPVRDTSVVNYLGIREVDIQPCANFRASALYLIHHNSADKFQYSVDDVTSNFDYKSLLGGYDGARAFSEITSYIIETDCKSWRKLTAWCIEQGYYQMLLRGTKLWEKIMYEVRTDYEENNNEVYCNGS